MNAAEALVARQVDAYNAQDLDAFVATFDPAVEFIGWPDRRRLHGHAAMRERYGALWASAPLLEACILERIVMGRFVIDLEQLLHHPDGERAPLVVIYETRDGVILRFWSITEDS